MVGALCLCAVDDVGDGQNAAGDWTGTYKNKGVIWRDDVAEEFHATQEHLLRSMCIHNKSHNLPLILGLNCVYIFPGVGISTLSSRLLVRRIRALPSQGSPRVCVIWLVYCSTTSHGELSCSRDTCPVFTRQLRPQHNGVARAECRGA